MDTRGEVLIWGLCGRHIDTIINIKLGNDDAEMMTRIPTGLSQW